jgi:hypothetical protein
MNKSISYLLVLAMMAGLAGCSKEEKELAGRWETDSDVLEDSRIPFMRSFTLLEDGSARDEQDETGSWKIADGRLMITIASTVYEYDYNISRSALTLSNANMVVGTSGHTVSAKSVTYVKLSESMKSTAEKLAKQEKEVSEGDGNDAFGVASHAPPPPILSADKIDQALRARPSVAQDLTRATQELQKARGLYDAARVRIGGKYGCIKHYKLYLAYRGSAMFEESSDEQKFITVLMGTNESRIRNEPDGLVPMVQHEYSRAVNLATDGRWPMALAAFQRLLDMVPEQDPQDPTYREFVSNVNKWRELSQSQMPKR